MATRPLAETVTVLLDGAGNGTASAGPLSAREVWHPSTIHIQVATNAAEAVCNVYVGDAPQQRCFRGNTSSGSTGDSTDSSDTVRVGHRIFAVWTGGDPRAYATMVITGSRDV